nr:MAG TPA: hypothetical protein [Caudoviricetes sp.]
MYIITLRRQIKHLRILYGAKMEHMILWLGISTWSKLTKVR